MKKQYQIVIAILVTGIFFCTSKNDNLKACGTNATACAATIQKVETKKRDVPKKDIPTEYSNETNAGIYTYMNPFIQ